MYGRAKPKIALCDCEEYGMSRVLGLHEETCTYVRAFDYYEAAQEDAWDERRLERDRQDAWERGVETREVVEV